MVPSHHTPVRPTGLPGATKHTQAARLWSGAVWEMLSRCGDWAGVSARWNVCVSAEGADHPPPARRPAPAFLSKLGSHQAPLPGPRLGRGPHAAPAKLQLPLVLGPSQPSTLNWGFRARTSYVPGVSRKQNKARFLPTLVLSVPWCYGHFLQEALQENSRGPRSPCGILPTC